MFLNEYGFRNIEVWSLDSGDASCLVHVKYLRISIKENESFCVL